MRRAVRDWKAVEELDRRGVAIARVALLAVLWFSAVRELGRGPDPGALWLYLGASCVLALAFRWVFLGARIGGWAAVPLGFVLVAAPVLLRAGALSFAHAFAMAAGYAVFFSANHVIHRQITSNLLLSAGALLVLMLAVSSPDAALPVAVGVCAAWYVSYVGAVRGAEAQRRAARTRQQRDPARESAEPENSPERRRLVEDAFALVQRAPGTTLGFGGRRGLGKSNVLRLLLARFAGPAGRSAPTEADLWKAKSALPRSIGVFIRTPTTFEELSFITALHEQVALAANRAVAGILPAVQPYAVERELQHKRRLLRPMHLLGAALVIVTVACSIVAYVGVAPDDPVVGAAARRWREPPAEVPGPAPRFARGEAVPPDLSMVHGELLMLSGLVGMEYAGAVPMNDTTWEGMKARHAELQRTWNVLAPYLARLDSARGLAAQARAIADSLALFEAALPSDTEPILTTRSLSTAGRGLFYAGLIGLPLLLLAAFRATREGDVRLRSRVYDPVRYVVALHERTNEVLDHLRFQLSLSESAQRSAGLSAGSWLKVVGINLSRSESRQVSRQARPYTVFSAAEEFRAYCHDVAFYLDEAAGRPPSAEGGFRIVVAVDELDKAADLQQLREMLKMMKAVLDVSHVSYLLSISQDALEQFRLRQVEGKDEIDGTFTHVFQVPPLAAGPSMVFFVGRGISRALLPAAVVLGGGVPRDMHRMAQLIGVGRGEQRDQTSLLDYLYARECAALREMLRGDPCIPEEARWRWAEAIPPTWSTPVAELAKVVETFRAMSPELFAAASPCPPEAARRTFHRVVALFVAHMAKARLYAEVARLPTPASLLDPVIREPLPPEVWAWMGGLEPLRAIFFHLESDPYGAWERLSAAAEGPAEPAGTLSGAGIA